LNLMNDPGPAYWTFVQVTQAHRTLNRLRG